MEVLFDLFNFNNIMASRSACCCGFGPVNEDNARFVMLALLIIIYLLCGAAVFSALEHPKEKQAKEKWAQRFEQFSQRHNLTKSDLEKFLRHYEEANVAGIRVDMLRPRWDFTGAFYFAGTVVSTIGERQRATAFYFYVDFFYTFGITPAGCTLLVISQYSFCETEFNSLSAQNYVSYQGLISLTAVLYNGVN